MFTGKKLQGKRAMINTPIKINTFLDNELVEAKLCFPAILSVTISVQSLIKYPNAMVPVIVIKSNPRIWIAKLNGIS
jgi:hypothetical protein